MKYSAWIVFVCLVSSVPVKGQDEANNNKSPCNAKSCTPPDCYCATPRVPNDFNPEDVPQMVIFSFSGTLARGEGEYLRDLFNPQRRNPNGSPIRMTLFVSDDDGATDYCTVNSFWAEGHEIGSFSVTRRGPPYWWSQANQNAWADEIDRQKRYIVENASIPAEDIVGFRSPHLQTGGNAQYRFATAAGYSYDSSVILPARLIEDTVPKLWPYTMHFPTGLDCHSHPCPTGSFPDLFQIPILQLADSYGQACSYLNTCRNKVLDAEEVFDTLMRTFNKSYNNNRVPVMINFIDYKPFFDDNFPWALEGVHRFIDEVLSYAADDVWLVTYQELVDWMKNPVENKLAGFTRPFMGPSEGEREEKACIERRVPKPFIDGVSFLIAEIIFCIIGFIWLYFRDNK